MITLYFVLLLLALISFTLSAFAVRAPVNLTALGLLFWVLVPLLNMLQRL